MAGPDALLPAGKLPHDILQRLLTRHAGGDDPRLLVGPGLGEDAAVIIHPGRILETIGPGHVIIIDSRDLASSNIAELEMGAPVAVENMILHAMVSGHGYDVDARRYLVAEELEASSTSINSCRSCKQCKMLLIQIRRI